jgi:hypothetical protein
MPLLRHRRSGRDLAQLVVALAVALTASAAHAIAQRTFVSPNGFDTNTTANCSLVAPCRSFGAAITVTNTDGEIIVLDSAGYGTVAINKSVSIISPPGIYAGVSVLTASTDGISVNGAGIDVTLKGITVNGQAPGTVGIRFTQGSRLDIDGCTISNLGAEGVRIDGPGTVSIANTTVIGNQGMGIRVAAAAAVTIAESLVESNGSTGISIEAGASATIEHTTVTKNSLRGIAVIGNIAGTRAAVTASVVADHPSGAGTYAEASAAGDVARLDVTLSTLARNASGVQVVTAGGGSAKAGIINNQIVENAAAGIATTGTASSIVRASWNGIFRNGAGFSAPAGSIYSPTTNYVRDNTTDGTPVADSLL